MIESQFKKLPGKSLSVFFLCMGILVVSYMLMFYPTRERLNSLNGNITNLQNKVEEQEILLPNHQKFLKMTHSDVSGILPSPFKIRLPYNKIEVIPIILNEVVQKSGLRPVSITLDLKSLVDEPRFLSVNTYIKGDLSNFRNLLLKLHEIPYIEYMEKIRIQGAWLSKEFRLKLWIAID